MTRRFVCAASYRCASRDSYLPLSELYSNSVTVRCTSVRRRRPSAFVLHCAQARYSSRRFPRSHYNPPAIHFRAHRPLRRRGPCLAEAYGSRCGLSRQADGPNLSWRPALVPWCKPAPERSNSMPHMRQAPAKIDLPYCLYLPIYSA